MCWVKSNSLLHRKVQHGPQSMQSPGGCSLFFWGFLGSSCWSTTAFERDHGLLLGTRVQLVVSCTTIEAQIVFKTLLTLVTGQLAIASQLGREVHPWNIGLLLGSRGQKWLWGRILGRWGHQRCICLVLGGHGRTRGGSFSLLPRVGLKDLFLHLPCIVVFTVSFLVAVIDSHC